MWRYPVHTHVIIKPHSCAVGVLFTHYIAKNVVSTRVIAVREQTSVNHCASHFHIPPSLSPSFAAVEQPTFVVLHTPSYPTTIDTKNLQKNIPGMLAAILNFSILALAMVSGNRMVTRCSLKALSILTHPSQIMLRSTLAFTLRDYNWITHTGV